MTNALPFPPPASPDKPVPLEQSERLFLWGFRAMAQHLRCGCPVVATVRQAYEPYQVEEAVASLEALLEAFAATAHSAIEFHAPGCPCLSASEALLLRAMAAAQCGAFDVARRTFECWLPELAADWVLRPAREIGRIFQAAGMTLPRRDVAGTTQMHGTAALPDWPAASQAVH